MNYCLHTYYVRFDKYFFPNILQKIKNFGILQSVAKYSDIVHRDDDGTIEIPKYNVERQETLEKRKARFEFVFKICRCMYVSKLNESK